MIGRSLRATARDDRGFGLAELVVTIFITGIVMTLVVTLFTNVSRIFTRENSATDSTNAAALGMNEITRVIRSGTEIAIAGSLLNDPVFVSAGKESVTLYAFIDTDSITSAPVKVRFSINADRKLVETRWASYALPAGYWGFQTAEQSSRIITSYVVVPAAGEKSLFTYYKADGSELVVPASGEFTVNERRNIAAVQVTMSVQADKTARANPVTLQNTVGIPNLGISRVGPS